MDPFNPLTKIIQGLLDNKKNVNTDNVEQLVALGLFGSEIKLVSLAKNGGFQFLDDTDQYKKSFYTIFSETAELINAIDQLETLVNNKHSKEKDFQDFFNRYKNFILNDDYRDAHPHIYLEEDNEDTLIPDFMLEPVEQSGPCDLLELKLPSTPIYFEKTQMKYFFRSHGSLCSITGV